MADSGSSTEKAMSVTKTITNVSPKQVPRYRFKVMMIRLPLGPRVINRVDLRIVGYLDNIRSRP